MTQQEKLDNILSKTKFKMSDFDKIASIKQTRSLTFLPKSKFPKHAFQFLADLERLQFLHFDNSKLSADNILDISKIKSLKRLDLKNCPIKDKMLPPLKEMPKLIDLWLNNTKVTDKGLAHIKQITGLEWLMLEGTKVTDNGMKHLTSNLNLRTLWLNRTKVTDKGLLELNTLTKLTAINTKDSRITDQGLDLLFAAQQEQIRQDKKKAPATDPNEIEAATSTLHSFFDVMKHWEESCVHNKPPDKEDGSLDMEAYDKFCSAQLEACWKIFAKFCTKKKRAYGRPDNLSYAQPSDYDRNSHQITEAEQETRSRIAIYTKEDDRRFKFVLLKKGSTWLVDHKKIWIDGWSSNDL